MSLEKYDESDPIQQRMDEVATRILKGKSELAIARELGIKRVEVIRYRDLWREKMQHDAESTDMARDHLNQMVEHYNRIIDKSYKVLDELDSMSFDEKVAAQKNTTLKNISEYEDKRVKALREAGLLDGQMGDEMAKMEEQHALLIDILRNDLCPSCRNAIASKLSRITGKAETKSTPHVEQIVDGEIVEDDESDG